jgi:hypothetical protein
MLTYSHSNHVTARDIAAFSDEAFFSKTPLLIAGQLHNE